MEPELAGSPSVRPFALGDSRPDVAQETGGRRVGGTCNAKGLHACPPT